jgi:hypothetical protein
LAKNISEKLDLVHVSIENWMTNLMRKIRDKEPDEEVEPVDDDGVPVVKPPYYTALEQDVIDELQAGKGPAHEMNIRIIKESMNSAEAKTKGLVLDLEFYKIPDEKALAEARAAEEALKAEEEEAAAAENDMEGSIKSKKSEAKSAGAAEPGAPVEGVEPAAAGDGGDTT